MPVEDMLGQIVSGNAVLFLGAGSTRNCLRPDGSRGLNGEELSREIAKKLNNGNDPGFRVTDLMQASEYFESVHPGGRSELDRFLKDRLTGLVPTLGHFIATTFPWRAVVTTNYNMVAEDAWNTGKVEGFACKTLHVVRTDDDLESEADESSRIRLYKAHGCISSTRQQTNPMVLTSRDYFASRNIRPRIFSKIVEACKLCSTVFVGYSLTDYTFKNIFYELFHELGAWRAKSYSVGPISNRTQEDWMRAALHQNFKTDVLNETFDSLMLKLAIARGTLHSAVANRAISALPNLKATSSEYHDRFEVEDVRAISCP
jgi:hypothetical protein